jgi:Zn-dependent protease with chaperone function
MDFFEAQARAHQRTKRLVFLFAFAVLGTVLAGYASVMFGLRYAGDIERQTRPTGSRHQAAKTALFTGWWEPRIFLWTAGGTLAVVGFASLYKWSQMRAGGSAVAEMVGGRAVDLKTTDLRERKLLNVIEEMSIASGIPMPAVYVLEDEPGLNAFAAGLTSSDAAVAVTRGTLDKLTRDELQGVIAHEFSHILNGDMRLNVRITAIVFGILVIGLLGRGLIQALFRGRVRSGGKKKGGEIPVILAIGLALMIIGYVGYFFGRLIQAAVSRQREFLADASAVQFTRNPGGITGALKKIGGYALGGTMVNPTPARSATFSSPRRSSPTSAASGRRIRRSPNASARSIHRGTANSLNPRRSLISKTRPLPPPVSAGASGSPPPRPSSACMRRNPTCRRPGSSPPSHSSPRPSSPTSAR